MENKNHNNKADARQYSESDNPVDINEVENIESEENEAEKEQLQEELDEVESLRQQLADSKAETEKEKKEYLFLMAEFDNFRKRNLKERSELIKNAGEKVLEGLLPIIDDFERSLQAINGSTDAESIREGVELIYNKFVKYLEQNGVTPIESAAGTVFDTESHEAVTTFPVDDPDLKGKIIDTVQKGYMLNDKVLRHAKVVVGK